MAKESLYATLAAPAANDLVPIIDVNDTSMAPTGTTKKITVASLLGQLAPSGDTTGATDTAAVNAALAAAPLGSVVTLQPGTWYQDAPWVIPPQVTLERDGGPWHLDASTCEIVAASGFSGASMILMLDQATGGYSVISSSQSIRNLILNGSNLTGSVDGIQSQGYVHGVTLEGVEIYGTPNHGIAAVSNSSGVAYSWRGTLVSANTCGGHGFSVGMTDCTWIDLEAIGNGLNGFNLAGSPSNSHFTNCRAEYNGSAHVPTQGCGFSLNGAWAAGTGSGGCLFTGCSTDGNWGPGVAVTATGSVPVIFDPLMLRRDGYGDTGAYASGLCIDTAGIPVTVGAISVFPGIALTGYANSPEYGVYCHGSTYFALASGWVHAATTAISQGSNTVCRINPNIGTATGATSSPTYNYDNPWATDSGSTFTANLNANDQTGIEVTQASGSTNTNNPLMLFTSGTSGSDILFKATYQGAAHSLFEALVSGYLQWGSGSTAVDTDLYRNSAGVLKTDGSLIVNTSLGLGLSAPSAGLAISDGETAPSTPSGGGILFGAGAGQVNLIDTNGVVSSLAQPHGIWLPSDSGWLAWNFDPAAIGSGATPTSGQIQASRINVRVAMSVTNVILFQAVAGTGLVTGSYAGLFTSSGTEVGITADQTSAWGTGTDVFKTMALASGPFNLAVGTYWVLWLTNYSGGMSPQWGRAQNNNSGSSNPNVGAGSARWATGAGTQTVLPTGGFTPSSYFTASATQYFAGLS